MERRIYDDIVKLTDDLLRQILDIDCQAQESTYLAKQLFELKLPKVPNINRQICWQVNNTSFLFDYNSIAV